jgi:three-Cys-motif partner protein
VEENFFAKPRPSSSVKLQIITEYFEAYMNKLARNKVVGYADLFAGPGVYDNGSESIPIVICKKVVADERLRRLVRLWFNEADPYLHARLQANLAAVPGVTDLRYAPAITRIVVSKGLAPSLARKKTPTLFFADPCGYKGLSLRLITAAGSTDD